MFRNNHPDTSLLFNKITTFIQKNVAISKFMQEISNDYLSRSPQSQDGEDSLSHSRKVDKLKKWIEEGQVDHDIFRDENCLMYLLYLIKNNQLEDNEALTLLIYLMGVQSDYNIEIIHINNDKNKDFKEKYIEEIVKKSKNIHIQLDKDKFNEEISKLSGVDAWVMIAKAPDKSSEISFLKQTTEGHTACLEANELKSLRVFEEGANRYGLLPSIEIMNKFVLQFNPYPIKYYPIFGIISLETLKRLHTLGYHPVQLHGGIFVKNNLEKAHNTRLKPFTILLHDLYHSHSGCLLSNEEHTYLYDSLIPELTSQIEILSKDDNSCKCFISILKDISSRLVDMDLGLLAHRVWGPNTYGKKLLHRWLIYHFNKATEWLSFQDFNLQTAIKFYYNLLSSNSISPDVVNDLSKISFFVPIIQGIKSVLSLNKENASTHVNIKVIKDGLNKNKWLSDLSHLLEKSKTVEDFVINLQSEMGLYCELMKEGFIYIPGFSIFSDDDFKEIQKLVNKKLVNKLSPNIISATDDNDVNRIKFK